MKHGTVGNEDKTLTVKINMSNAAFDDCQEAGRILKRLGEEIDAYDTGDNITLHDINGNTVGSAKITA